MGREVKVGRREATLVISKRFEVTLAGIGPVMGAAFGDVYGHVQGQGIPTAGPPFVIYHGMPDGDRPFALQVCAPVGAAPSVPAGWEAQELPAGLFATLLHVGPYDTIGTAYDELGAWLGTHGLGVAGPPREVYLSEPDVPPEETRTIVEFPVVEAEVPIGAS